MKKKFKKQIVALILSLIMLVGIMPMTAYAVAYNTYDVSGRTQSGNNTAFIRYGLTDDAAGSFSVFDNETSVRLNLTLNDGWYLEKWDTWFNGAYDKAIVSDPDYNESNPNFDDRYTFFNISQTKLPTNAKYIVVRFLASLYGDFRVNAVVRPILTVNAGNGVSYQVTANNAISVEQGVAVEYGKSASVTYSVDDKHVITGISANYGTQYVDNGSVVTMSSIVRPAMININTRPKLQNVNFDANGGEGIMTKQTFEHSMAQTLTANAFTNTGYIFAGWNTKTDGSGIAYADNESITFTPVNDGENITLFAQWTQCTDHNWEDSKCTKCDALCSHFGGNATCTQQATCDACGEKYGALAKHNVVYNASQNRIVETCTAGCGHIATADIVRDENVGTVYSGSAIEALKVVYSDNWKSGNLDIQYTENVDVGTASGTISIGGETAKETFEITAATMTNVSAQGYSGVYDGQAHSITVNAPAGASVSYKVGDGNYSTENPVFKNVGTYTVSYKVSMANHTDVEGSAEVKIDKASLIVIANDHSILYGEAPANNGVIYSGFVANETETVLGGTLAFDYTYAVGNNIGSYEITPKGLTSDNYGITFVKGTLNVNKADVTYTTPTAKNPTYTGGMLELLTAGAVDGGTMVFSFDKEGGYGETLSAKDAGNYTVWYKVIGDDNHNDSVPASINVEIKMATPDLGTVSVSGTVYDTTKPQDVVLVRTNTEIPGKLSIEKAGDLMRADKTEYYWEFVPTDTDNYEVIYGYIEIDVVDTVAPTVSISIDDRQWTFWNIVTFGLFYNEGKEVAITYADNENGSGLKDMLYYVADKEMSVDELKDIQWTAYSEAFNIDPDGKYVIYAKAVDNDENTIIINSDGYVLDNTQAVVEDLTNGGIYYGQLVFTVADELAGVKSVVIDDSDESHFEDQYVINGDNAEHTIVIMDNAGNMTEYTVTVYKNYTVTYKADEKIVSTQIVGHGKDAAPPAVPAQSGYTGKWDHDGKNITSDIIINAVYTENSAPVPNGPQSPETGDSSNMALWITLCFISGGTMIVLTVVERKKRTVNR